MTVPPIALIPRDDVQNLIDRPRWERCRGFVENDDLLGRVAGLGLKGARDRNHDLVGATEGPDLGVRVDVERQRLETLPRLRSQVFTPKW